jgi:uncharacterized OB-fold protein
MSAKSIRRDVSDLEITMDTWTEPHWRAAAERRLVVPQCGSCGHFRWPPSPFCPECLSQDTQWVSPGTGRIFSFTILPDPAAPPGDRPRYHVPALIRFDDAGGTILLGSLVDAPLDAIAMNAAVAVDWSPAVNTNVPIFRLAAVD